MTAENKLAALGLTLPVPAAPVANYVSYVTSGNLVFISGQISKIGDEEVKGRLGEGLSVAQGGFVPSQTCGEIGRLCASHDRCDTWRYSAGHQWLL